MFPYIIYNSLSFIPPYDLTVFENIPHCSRSGLGWPQESLLKPGAAVERKARSTSRSISRYVIFNPLTPICKYLRALISVIVTSIWSRFSLWQSASRYTVKKRFNVAETSVYVCVLEPVARNMPSSSAVGSTCCSARRCLISSKQSRVKIR